MDTKTSDDFERAAGQGPPTALGEIWAFLRQNQKWWLLPILAVLLLLGYVTLLLRAAATRLTPSRVRRPRQHPQDTLSSVPALRFATRLMSSMRSRA
jgi:hypothetical protein